MAHDPVDSFRRTARIRREDVPQALHELGPDEVAHLTELLQSALDRRHEEIEASIDEGLGMVPRPLRGPVKKALGI